MDCCACGVRLWQYTGAPCCTDRLIAAMHRSRPETAFWYLANIKHNASAEMVAKMRASWKVHREAGRRKPYAAQPRGSTGAGVALRGGREVESARED